MCHRNEAPDEIPPEDALKAAEMTLEDCVFDSVVPACCEDGCMVEPDGVCPHGCRSVLLVLGII